MVEAGALVSARLARKGRRQIAREEQTDLEVQLGEARAERDKALAKAGAEFRDGLEKLQQARHEARAAAYKAYEKKRDTLVKRAVQEDTAA